MSSSPPKPPIGALTSHGGRMAVYHNKPPETKPPGPLGLQRKHLTRHGQAWEKLVKEAEKERERKEAVKLAERLRECPFDPAWTREEELAWANAQEPVEFEPVKRKTTTKAWEKALESWLIASTLICLIALFGVPIYMVLLHFGVI